MTNKARKW